jgi:hypothetical protein
MICAVIFAPYKRVCTAWPFGGQAGWVLGEKRAILFTIFGRQLGRRIALYKKQKSLSKLVDNKASMLKYS